MTAYYNELDPFAAAWLRELIKAGHIAPGDVDERSIDEVQPDDLVGYTQCHFFAGIGGWGLALRLAGWSDTKPVWTGSCPCQPFSVAGKRAGTADKRHLWPDFGRLIAQRNPATVFGEQVASKDGRAWLAGVRLDLENMGYAVGGGDLCAAGVGAPHIRQRLYWVAHNPDSRRREECEDGKGGVIGDRAQGLSAGFGASCSSGRLAIPNSGQCLGITITEGRDDDRTETGRQQGDRQFEYGGTGSWMADSERAGLERHARNVADRSEPRWIDAHAPGSTSESGGDSRLSDAGCVPPWRAARPCEKEGRGAFGEFTGYSFGGWGDNWIGCADGKARRIESGLEPLAHGIPGRVGKLRGYGNAIVPALAAEFVMAAQEAML